MEPIDVSRITFSLVLVIMKCCRFGLEERTEFKFLTQNDLVTSNLRLYLQIAGETVYFSLARKPRRRLPDISYN